MPDLIDIILEGGQRLLDWVTSQFTAGLRESYRTLTAELFDTPTPDTTGVFVFGAPRNEPWPTLREAVLGGEVMVLAYLLLIVCVQARHTARIFNLGHAGVARRTRRTAWTGGVLIFGWYWLATGALVIVDVFTAVLLPDFQALRPVLLDFVRGSIQNPMLGFFLWAVGGAAMWVLEAIYLLRELLVYVYVWGMPLGIAVAFGNVPVVSRIAARFLKQFVPLVILPLPGVILLRGYHLLFVTVDLTLAEPYVAVLVGAALPVIALWLTWRTFRYAAPLLTDVAARTGQGLATAGVVAGAAYAAGPAAAATAARYGPGAAAAQTAARQTGSRTDSSDDGQPSYRRTENDPLAPWHDS